LFGLRLHCSKRAGQVRIGVEHDTVDADRQCRHNGTLDHLMGRFFEQHAILEGAGLSSLPFTIRYLSGFGASAAINSHLRHAEASLPPRTAEIGLLHFRQYGSRVLYGARQRAAA
jgi:hypothetical protein